MVSEAHSPLPAPFQLQACALWHRPPNCGSGTQTCLAPEPVFALPDWAAHPAWVASSPLWGTIMVAVLQYTVARQVLTNLPTFPGGHQPVFEIGDHVTNLVELFTVLVADLDIERPLQCHGQFHYVQRVGAEGDVVDRKS